MKITVMGVLIVIGGILLLVFLMEHVLRTSNEPKQSEPKVEGR
jgi:hypothetical protein